MRTRVVIQSRLSSSRLPGKALMMVGGMPLLELVARRAGRTGFEVVVATSEESYDDRIATVLQHTGIRVVRGPLDDVLARFVMATSDMAEEDTVIRLTGDNPVMDADLIQELMDAVREAGAEYGLYDMARVPEGLGVEVFPVRLLRRAAREASSDYDREHVTPWIRRHTEELSYAPRFNPGLPSVYRVSVDCLHDFTRVARLFDEFADPVAVPWPAIMESLIGQVRGLGPIAHEAPRLTRRTSTVLLGVASLTHGGRESQAATVRSVCTRAVEAGVSDIVCSSEDAHVVNVGLLPMLRQRMGVSILLPRVAQAACPDMALRFHLERARVDSGHAQLRSVALPASDLATEHGGRLGEVLQEYRDAGIIAEVAVLLDADLDPAAWPSIDVVFAARADAEAGARLEHWGAAGKFSVMLLEDADPAEAKRALTNRADAVVVQPATRRELTSVLTSG